MNIKRKKNKEKDERIVVGSIERMFPDAVEKKCEKCGDACYFVDDWDFKKYKIICMRCALKDNFKFDAVVIHPHTIRNFAQRMGLEEWEACIMIQHILENVRLGNIDLDEHEKWAG